ncbi:hypothetical protein GCM10022239_02870 [Leifsonia bigeumensis]|uniref:ABC transporter permease n=1 Tax=Leifsonella bigeumensis TaxID=433643 RepID=A0ABP7F3Q0_9MICO
METPSLRDRLRPLELLGLSAVIGLFTGLVLLLTTREVWLAAIGFGVAFILSVVTIALLALSATPNADERTDLDEQDRAGH